MTTIQGPTDSFESILSVDEIRRAIHYFVKERERVKLKSRRRREQLKATQSIDGVEPTEPTEPKTPKKSNYQPTGRPRGRPRKENPPV